MWILLNRPDTPAYETGEHDMTLRVEALGGRDVIRVHRRIAESVR